MVSISANHYAARRFLPWQKGVSALFILVLLAIAGAPASVYAQSPVLPPTFSVIHGHFSTSFQLTLSTSTPDAQIRYTTDFSTPTPTNGIIYTAPILIDKTMVVRAVAYTSAADKSTTMTQTYLFTAQVRNQSNSPGSGWPSIFAPRNSDGGPYPAYYEVAPEIVNHPNNAGQFENALLALPSISLVTDLPNLWDPETGIYTNPNEKGADWERPASLEWITPTGVDAGFAVNAGVRLHGQASRRPHRTAKKTFRFYFRNIEYGVAKLDYKLFADNDAVSKFDRILLRGGGNRSYPYFDRDQRREADYINDEFARRAFLAMGGLAAHGTYAHLYLNGQYWGLYNVTERLDGQFLTAYFGGVPEDYDLIEPDEEVDYQPVADPGTIDAWNALQNLLNVTTVNNTVYQQALTQLDVVDLADYMILMHYIANTDWPAHNWYTYRKRSGPDTRFHMIPWDSDTSLNDLTENMTEADVANTPARLFHKLMTNAEFRQVVADRLYRHLQHSQGALTPTQCGQQYRALADTVDLAIIGESARWGAYALKVYPQIDFASSNKALPAYLHSRDMPAADADPANAVEDDKQKNWMQVRDAKLSIYCPFRTGVVIDQYIANGWYQITVKAPTFAQDGGAVAAAYGLTIDNAINNGVGTIYYTVDGSDPRQSGGSVAAGVLDGGDMATVIINQVTTVRARVLADGIWSPLQEATFYPPQPLANLVINEIHYHPLAPVAVDGDVFEFIELYNKGDVPLRVDHLRFTRGFTYQFPPNTTIAPGAYFVLSPDAQQFQARYGFSPQGIMRGNLANGGEAIELIDAVGNLIDFVDYLDLAPWPITPDGSGPSLSLIQPPLDNALPANWAPSLADHGTPGQPNGLTLPNQLPTVALTSPAASAVFTQGVTLTLQAEAADGDGVIQQVEFLVGDTVLCTVTASPYSCTFTPAVGGYLLAARATDNVGGITTSPATSITVIPVLQAPTVTLTSPAPDAVFAQGATVLMQAEASDSDGVILQVDFFVDDSLLCTAFIPPYTCTFVPALGNHLLTARATDSQGLSKTTAAVPITVNALPSITVTISSPAPNSSLPLTIPTTIVAEVSGADAQRVEFFADEGGPICVDDTAPYTCAWQPTITGVYTLKATAYGVAGVVDSATVTVNIADQPVVGTDQPLQLYLPLISR